MIPEKKKSILKIHPEEYSLAQVFAAADVLFNPTVIVRESQFGVQ